MPYRIEISPTGRAGCQAPHCKKAKIKIAKGEVRHGVLVTIQEHTNWTWRHWGCVTPPVIHNWWEEAEHDLDRIDGLDEVPEEVQETVKRALQQGHVDDEDWAGDVECNRYTGKSRQGMFLSATEKAAIEKAEGGGTKKSAGKKRGRPANTEDTDDDDHDHDHDDEPAKPAAKKVRGKQAANADDEDEAPAKKARGRPKKAALVDDDAEQEEEAEAAPKKARGRPRKSLPADDAEVKDEEDAPKKARGRPRKSLPADDAEIKDEEDAEVEAEATVTPAKKARGRPRKSMPAADADADETEPATPATASAKKGRGRPKKEPQAEPQAEPASDGAEAAPKKARGRPRKSV